MKHSHPKDLENPLWPQTDWSGLGRASEAVGKDADRLNHLILLYRVPLKVYLVSTFPGLSNQAEEFLQDFAQDKILREGWLGKADRKRGRLRDFLKTSLRNFVNDRLRREANPPASLDEMEFDPPEECPGVALFDLNWARTILAETLARMEKDCKTPGKEQPNRDHIWEIFRLRILQPILEDAPLAPYEELIVRLGIASPFAAQNMLATAKRIFTRHLNGVIAEYEKGENAVKAEIEEIKRFLSRLSKKEKP